LKQAQADQDQTAYHERTSTEACKLHSAGGVAGRAVTDVSQEEEPSSDPSRFQRRGGLQASPHDVSHGLAGLATLRNDAETKFVRAGNPDHVSISQDGLLDREAIHG